MKTVIIIFITVLISFQSIFSQDNRAPDTFPKIVRNMLYGTMTGAKNPVNTWSINYERQILDFTQVSINLRFGVGLYFRYLEDDPGGGYPDTEYGFGSQASSNFIHGKKSLKFELDLGVVWPHQWSKKLFYSKKDEELNKIYFTGNIGMRYRPSGVISFAGYDIDPLFRIGVGVPLGFYGSIGFGF